MSCSKYVGTLLNRYGGSPLAWTWSHVYAFSKNDWSLHRKGPIDQARHNQKVKEAIKGNLGGIVGEESIITSDGKRIMKMPTSFAGPADVPL